MNGPRSFLVCGLVLLAACGLPSKGEALDLIAQGQKEDASCTLPIDVVSKLKLQHVTKAICVPMAGLGEPPAQMNQLTGCFDALVAAGATKAMPSSYMVEWTDEIQAAGFDRVGAYDRKARDLVYRGCYEMGSLREGRFKCGEAKASAVVRVAKKGETQAQVRYARALTLDPSLAKIEAACGAISRPPEESSVTMEKTDGKWALVSEPAQ